MLILESTRSRVVTAPRAQLDHVPRSSSVARVYHTHEDVRVYLRHAYRGYCGFTTDSGLHVKWMEYCRIHAGSRDRWIEGVARRYPLIKER